MNINENIDLICDEIEENEQANWAVTHAAAGTSIAIGAGASIGIVGAAAAAIFGLVAGGYALYKYINSIGRLKSIIKQTQARIQSEKNPVKLVNLKLKLTEYNKKLQESQKEARIKKADFIKATKLMQQELVQAKANKNQEAVLKLQKELQNRQKVMSKIGAI